MRLRLAWMAVSVVVALSPAAAQDKAPIRLLVGVQAGATTDLVARQLAEKLRDSLGEVVVVENKPGAAQRIALAELKKAPPDGRTMVLVASAAFSIMPHIYGDRLGYDPVKDFTPVTRVVAFQVGFGAGLQTRASNIAEFIAWAKANPAQASFASPGAGTSSHFAGLMFAKAAGIQMTHVPYKGSAPALTDLIGGHIAMLSTAFSDLPGPHRAGKIRIIAIAGTKRSPAVPEVATLREQGIDIGFDVAFDLYTSANVPPDIVKRLNAALVQATLAADSRRRFEAVGLQPAGTTAEELAAKQAEEFRLWAEPVKASGFTGE
ncbi:MAG TPA: tripartite tricarboxylate transporter substrate-binding protein [Xanthobacteraceae bacterium]